MTNQPQVIVDEVEGDALDNIVDRILGDEEPETVEEVAETEESEEETKEPEEEEFIEIRHNGKPVKLKLEEVIEHAQKGFDYTTKTQELAEQRRNVEQYAQAIQRQAEFTGKFQQDLSQITAMDMQLQQFQNVNWDQWMDSDPVEASKGYQRYQMLRQTREDTARQVSSRQAQAQAEMERVNHARLAESAAELERDLGTAWNAETRKALSTHGKNYGFTDAELGNIQDPRVVKVLLDAYKYRQLQDQKPEINKKVSEAPKIAKPGSKPTGSADMRTQKLSKILKTSQSRSAREHAAMGLLDKFV
jgi:hypothetical protein